MSVGPRWAGKPPALRPADHQVEHHLAVVLPFGTGGMRGRHHAAGLGAVPDELQLRIGDQALVHQHPVECGPDGDHVVGECQLFPDAGSKATSSTAPGRISATTGVDPAPRRRPVNFCPDTLSTSTVIRSDTVLTVPIPTAGTPAGRAAERRAGHYGGDGGADGDDHQGDDDE